jgi:uncharacterized protein YjiK
MARRSERNMQIIELRLSGSTLSQIGARFNMSKQAVHYITKDEWVLLREYLEDMEKIEQGSVTTRDN